MKKYVGLILVFGLIFQLSAVAAGASYNTVNFNYNVWGSYYTVSYTGEQYFAGYVGGGAISSINVFTFNITSNSGQLHRVLMDDNSTRILNIGDSLTLGEGYQFQFTSFDITNRVVFVNLLKNGVPIDSSSMSAGTTYKFTKNVGNFSNLPTIALHVNSIFINKTSATLFIKGVFQISETFITVNPMSTPTSTPTLTPTPTVTISPTPTVTISPTPTVTISPTPTVTISPTPTVTISPTPTVTTTPDVQNSKVAILQVVYNIGRKDNGAEVTVTLKNIGNSTARFVNLSMNIPTELGAALDSGAKMDGNTMVWKGDIEPGNEHVIKYHVEPVKADIEIPVRITYINSEKTLNKVLAKASVEGMSASAIPIDPQDLQTILLIIQIAKSLTPGFEIVLAIVGIGVVYALRK